MNTAVCVAMIAGVLVVGAGRDATAVSPICPGCVICVTCVLVGEGRGSGKGTAVSSPATGGVASALHAVSTGKASNRLM